jgi:hypothetical protein
MHPLIKAAESPLNTVGGDHNLCAWQPVRGVTWVQTRNPLHARRLARRSDGRRVVVGVAGGYLRTYEFVHPLSWAIRLIQRYTSNRKATGAGLSRSICPVRSPQRDAVGRHQAEPRPLLEAINPALGTSAISASCLEG